MAIAFIGKEHTSIKSPTLISLCYFLFNDFLFFMNILLLFIHSSRSSKSKLISATKINLFKRVRKVFRTSLLLPCSFNGNKIKLNVFFFTLQCATKYFYNFSCRCYYASRLHFLFATFELSKKNCKTSTCTRLYICT